MSALARLFDNLLWTIAPRWKARREIVRQLFKRQTMKAASRERLQSHWITQLQGPNAHMLEREVVMARANYLYLNDPFVRGAVDMFVNRVIGAGSVPQAQTESDIFNEKAEKVFALWAEEADYHRQYHFGDIQRLALRKKILDGGVFLHKVVDKNRTVPLCLEVLEYSRLAPIGQPAEGNVNVGGVEIDPERGLVVAYHFYIGHPKDPWLIRIKNQTIRIPAEDLIHYGNFTRPGQFLGVPILASAIPYAMNLSELIEAELVAAKVAACFGIVIKTPDVYGRLAYSQRSEQGDRHLEIAPGMVEFLEPGEEIEVINPKRPGQTFDDFVKLILRGIARSLGMSYEQIAGDKSEVNYSSARHSELEFRDVARAIQAELERYVLRPVWREFIRHAVLKGLVGNPGPPPQDLTSYFAHRWIHKGFDWVDPQKEAKAKAIELRLGLTTLADEAAARGKDWEELARQRAREKDFLNELGLLDPSQQEIRADGLLTRPEETENYIRIPVPGEEGKHRGHRIRTITLSEREGIKALYCVDCKVITTYLFAKEKGWTMEKAKQWVKDHLKKIGKEGGKDGGEAQS